MQASDVVPQANAGCEELRDYWLPLRHEQNLLPHSRTRLRLVLHDDRVFLEPPFARERAPTLKVSKWQVADIDKPYAGQWRDFCHDQRVEKNETRRCPLNSHSTVKIIIRELGCRAGVY